MIKVINYRKSLLNRLEEKWVVSEETLTFEFNEVIPILTISLFRKTT